MELPIDRSQDLSNPVESLHENERVKKRSRFLRGDIDQSLIDAITGAVSDSDRELLKFHGIYQQDDRDLRDERRKQKLEPAYQFMIRVRLPGGELSPEQWLQLDRLADRYADGSLRLTTRQTFQFHYVLKQNLVPLIRGLREVGLDSIAACGDDTRGVMCGVNPSLSSLHREVYQLSRRVSDSFIPKSGAYANVWYGEGPSAEEDGEPLYGETYLPRKFKIGFALPPSNDIDVFTQDLGFIAITENQQLVGFNIAVGGGMGRQSGNPATYPRLADVIGFVTTDKVFTIVEQVISIQRDFGNRKDRQQARFKYTLDKHGLDWFQQELENRIGFELEVPRDYHFTAQGDRLGWHSDESGHYYYGLFVESGRVNGFLKAALKDLASILPGTIRITPNQNILFCGIPRNLKDHFAASLASALPDLPLLSPTKAVSIACVAFPTCGLAMAESERFLPSFISRLEELQEKHGIQDIPIVTRVSGCPNGCSRPYAAEIGLTGRAPGKYDLFLGGGRDGRRLNKLALENVSEVQILATLDDLFADFSANRRLHESFGDFAHRRQPWNAHKTDRS